MEYLGHEVVGTASNGEEVLKQYALTQPELVLMDVRMPRMDGLTCAALLAKQHPQAKVVIITAGRATASEVREAGARALVEKPFEVAALGQVIQEVCAA
jgi:DNA-binding NarL/FixJ family response regulator